MRVTTIPHTTAQTSQFMNSLRFLASKNALSKSTMVSVGEIDGSANVSTITKTYYLIVYFLLNLALTLYNKAVMIQVCLDIVGQGWSSIMILAKSAVVSIPVSLDRSSHRRWSIRNHRPAICRLLPFNPSHRQRQLRPLGLLGPLHRQYRHLERVPPHGHHPVSPSSSRHIANIHYLDLWRRLPLDLLAPHLPIAPPRDLRRRLSYLRRLRLHLARLRDDSAWRDSRLR